MTEHTSAVAGCVCCSFGTVVWLSGRTRRWRGSRSPATTSAPARQCQVLGDTTPDTLQPGLMLGTAYLRARNIGRAIPQLQLLMANQQTNTADFPTAIHARIDYAAKCYAQGHQGQTFQKPRQ